MFRIKEYTAKLLTDGITKLDKGSLNYSEENKLGESLYGNVYHGDYDGMSVAVKQFKRNNLHELIVEANVSWDLQTIRLNELFPYFCGVSSCTLPYVLVTQLLFSRTAEKRESINFCQALKIDGLLNKNDKVQLLDGTSPNDFNIYTMPDSCKMI